MDFRPIRGISPAEAVILAALIGATHKPVAVEQCVAGLLPPQERLTLATAFAVAAHGATGQTRSYTGAPYHEHAMAVVDTLVGVTRDVDIHIAGMLHDVVEDTKITVDTIREFFGSRIAKLVDEVTDRTSPQDGNRRTRRDIERQRLATVSNEAKTIKLADMIDNIRDIGAHDPGFAKVYMPEKARLLPSLIGGNPALYNHALGQVDAYFRANPGISRD